MYSSITRFNVIATQTQMYWKIASVLLFAAAVVLSCKALPTLLQIGLTGQQDILTRASALALALIVAFTTGMSAQPSTIAAAQLLRLGWLLILSTYSTLRARRSGALQAPLTTSISKMAAGL